ncbi:MAG: NAD(+) synthase [Dehalococcoidales bacterium]|nr:NAD(+) synthase [Dehalococcoidales bacterium]
MNTQQLAGRLVLWIREKVSAAGLKGTVFGISGGLDSSVVAVLCRRAFTKNTLGLVMPCYSSQQDEQHAMAVASKFSIPTQTLVLDDIYDSLLKILPLNEASATSQMTRGNLKARLRMLTLYFYANQLRYLVVGSGNRSELAVGYFTKHGDGSVDILPLGNLVKRQVKELAEFLEIPQEIINKPPSAGLWLGQTDEDELGLSYNELDDYLTGGKVPEKIRQKIEKLIASSGHKRKLPPVPDFQ